MGEKKKYFEFQFDVYTFVFLPKKAYRTFASGQLPKYCIGF